MRTARLRGLSEDGQSLIVETGDGEQIAILADAQLRQALRDVRPRPQLETEMESGMTPREIQMRIRAGASVEELVEASGMSIARVEAFAAPVLAEREHVAGQAQLASVRRAGESAAHRTLRNAVGERLREQQADPDAVTWDSSKLEDGRWSVTARYRISEEDRAAAFTYDTRGRFSIAGDDEARWVIGESAGSGTGDAEGDSEPTVKLHGDADELALIRAVETEDPGAAQQHSSSPADDQPAPGDAGAPDTPARPSVTLVESDAPTEVQEAPAAEAPEPEDDAAAAVAAPETPAASPEPDHRASSPEVEPESQLDLLYDLLGGDGYAEESTHIYDGLSDATAVPDLADGGWPTPPDDAAAETGPSDPEPSAAPAPAEDTGVAEPTPSAAPDPTEETADADPEMLPVEHPPTEVDEPAQDALPYAESVDTSAPAESPVSGSAESPQPGPDESLAADDLEPAPEAPAAPSDETANAEPPRSDAASTDTPTPEIDPESAAGAAGAEESEPAEKPESTEDQAESKPATKSTSKSKKRKRASVPSWDEIMFGSPKK